MPETKRQQHNITSGYIQIVVESDIRIPAYWSHPVVGGPFPGVVLLHDDWGLTPQVRSFVHRLAEIGCYVLAPDLFDGHRATEQVTADKLKQLYLPHAEPKVNAALLALETHRKTNGKMALVGWELGAELTMPSALNRSSIIAVVASYGDLSPYMGQLGMLRCPLMAIYGKDNLSDTLVPALQPIIASSSDYPHEILTYPQAHGRFCNDATPDYHPEAAADAWEKMIDFLEKHHGIRPAPSSEQSRFFKPGRVF